MFAWLSYTRYVIIAITIEANRLNDAMFTLGQNVFSLITNETCSSMKSVYMRHSIAQIINQNMFILSAIKTTSQGSFDLSQAKHVNANVVHLLNTAMPFIPEGLDE